MHSAFSGSKSKRTEKPGINKMDPPIIWYNLCFFFAMFVSLSLSLDSLLSGRCMHQSSDPIWDSHCCTSSNPEKESDAVYCSKEKRFMRRASLPALPARLSSVVAPLWGEPTPLTPKIRPSQPLNHPEISIHSVLHSILYTVYHTQVWSTQREVHFSLWLASFCSLLPPL